jgi:molecular chaperone GrpE (heat shock protein)
LDTDQEQLKPYDLDLIVDDLDDESNQLRELQARLNNFDQDLDLKMADLKNKTNMSGDMKAMQDLIDNLNKEINEICGDLNENENSIKGIIPQLAGQLTLASAMLTEMKNGSEPEGGDYWDHRKQIEKNA